MIHHKTMTNSTDRNVMEEIVMPANMAIEDYYDHIHDFDPFILLVTRRGPDLYVIRNYRKEVWNRKDQKFEYEEPAPKRRSHQLALCAMPLETALERARALVKTLKVNDKEFETYRQRYDA